MASDSLPALAGPARTTPARLPRSVRRTTNIDTSWPGGMDGDIVHQGRARDLVTTAAGSAAVAATASFQARVEGRTRHLMELQSVPERPELQQVLGAMVGPGFRGRVAQVIPEEAESLSLLNLLLDDLPAASLVSGYAVLYAGASPSSSAGGGGGGRGLKEDLCAGWAADATMMTALRTTGSVPVPYGPAAPVLEAATDVLGWHDMDPLPPNSMRRRRRIDVCQPGGPGQPYRADVFFRDSHVDPAGNETVVHEYALAVDLDPSARTILDVAATADVLPWTECPGALGSATRVRGQELSALRQLVRREFVGTTTCTHLNDVLRGLADVHALAGLMPRD